MKANAKKLLALILAMVMCLSLAAPAMAAAEKAVAAAGLSLMASTENYQIVASEDGSGDYKIYKGTKTTNPTPTNLDLVASGNVTEKTHPAGVTVDLITPAKELVGEKRAPAEYSVKYSVAVASDTDYAPATTVKYGKDGAKVAFVDVESKFVALDAGQTYTGTTGQKYQVKGSIYQEEQGNTGTYKAYFKLATATASGSFDESTCKFFVYPKSGTTAKITTATAMDDALANAVCVSEPYAALTGFADAGKGIYDAGCALEAETLDPTSTYYGFVASNATKGLTVECTQATLTTSTKSSGTLNKVEFTDEDLATATFNLTIKDTSYNDKTGAKIKDAYVTDVATATKVLNDKWPTSTNAKLESVAVASGNTLLVTVSQIVTAKPYDVVATSSDLYAKNVWFYMGRGKANAKDEQALLIDVDKAGFYNATSAQGGNAKEVPAGTVCLGPVLVKKADISSKTSDITEVTSSSATFTTKYAVDKTQLDAEDSNNGGNASNDYYVFKSVDAMKKGIKAGSCKDGKNIPYTQVILNPYKGSTKNGLVNATAIKTDVTVKDSDSKESTKNLVNDALAQVKWNGSKYVDNAPYGYTYTYASGMPVAVKLASGWADNAYATPNKDFVQTGTLTVDAAEHGTKVKVSSKVDGTCEKPGTETINTVCTICNQVLATETKEIPIDTNPLEMNPKAEEDKPETLVFGENDKTAALADQKHKTSHWAMKAVTETTTSEDKSKTIVTTTIYCNYNVKHDVIVQEVNKTSLQNAGKFSFIYYEGRNEEKVITDEVKDSLANLFGYTDGIVIADSDVEIETLPLKRKSTDIPKDNRTTVDGNGDDLTIKFASNALCAPGTTNLDSTKKNADGSYTAYTSVTLNDVYANATATPVTKYYTAVLTAKVNHEAVYKCFTGSGTIKVDVYEVTKKADGFSAVNHKDAVGSTYLEKNVKKGYVTLLQSYSKDVVIRAQKAHLYDEKTGICQYCLQSREAVDSAKFLAETVTVENMNWTGKVAQPEVTVYDTKGNKLLEGIDYVVETFKKTDAGEYNITVKGIEDYAGNRVTVPFTINKVAATLKKKSAPSKLTASATKKVTGQIKMTVKGGKVAKYKVTKKVSGVSVNKSGKITVKKGNKKAGTLKVKVTMTPDANHTAAKAVTVKVAIKAAPAAKKTTKK